MLNTRNGLMPMISNLVYWTFATSLCINAITFILFLVKDKSLWQFLVKDKSLYQCHEKNVCCSHAYNLIHLMCLSQTEMNIMYSLCKTVDHYVLLPTAH